MALLSYAVLFVFCIVLTRYIRKWRSPLARLPLPPGPKPLPIIGNILDMPPAFVWETYDKWYKEFKSDIVYASAVGAPIVIVNTYEAAVELFEKRSSLYSSRPRTPMAGELMGWDWDFGFLPYGDKWRTYRRLFHQAFNSTASKQFEPQQLRATQQLLLRLIECPGNDNLMDHLRHMAASVILDIIYGIKVLPDNDPYIFLAERATRTITEASNPGRFWVDFFPWLKYIPKWFPGAGFRYLADEWAEYAKEMVETPFKVTKQSMAEGHFTPSFTSYSLDKLNSSSPLNYDERAVQDVAAVAYIAGADTTVAALSTFALAMLRYPDVQKRAQAELEDILHGHLPTFQDQDSLPYVTAVVYETLRWKAVTPFGVPHLVESEDMYDGYRIPAGSMVIPNCWSMLYDENVYPDPATFQPERFLKDGKLNPEVRDPRLIVFGFGRRICPGRYMGYSSVWITIASMLATMNITKAMDSKGKVIEPSGDYISALVHTPKPFACTVTPRSKNTEALIREAALSDE